ncbi:MAG: amidohydrolase family protein [Actinomycetota bacterium]|jgi:predicted TIM-barrel fold metal-dependent hydrolase
MYKIFSVDDHVVEPADVWSSRVPAKFRDAAPHVIEEGGREFWVYEDQRAMTMGLNAVAGKPREQWSLEPTRFADMIPGCYDPKERARDMLSQGVLASVCFPTLPRFGGMLFNSFKDKELADVCVKAWNDFILDEWCPGGPEGMFVPMIICQVWDPQLAADEIRRCAAKGAKALAFTENPVPDGLPGFYTDHWDPLWQAVTEVDIPVCMHIASSGYVPMPDPSAGLGGAIVLANVGAMMSMVNLVLSPVCHNFPTIKIVYSEGGVGWIPAVLERADRQVERQQWAGLDRGLMPSEVFRRNMYACMIEEPLGLTYYNDIGLDRIVMETDYPHSDSTYPYTQKSCEEVFAGMPDDVIEAVTHTNAERLFNWKMADESLLTSPDVSEWRSTLEADPYAALQTCHDVEGVTRLGAEGVATCEERILEGSIYTKCGKAVGPDGVCEAGHKA